jgi:hypothetical protein
MEYGTECVNFVYNKIVFLTGLKLGFLYEGKNLKLRVFENGALRRIFGSLRGNRR